MNVEVEELASEVAAMAHETKTEAIRRALMERRARLQARAKPGGRKSLRDYLEQSYAVASVAGMPLLYAPA